MLSFFSVRSAIEGKKLLDVWKQVASNPNTRSKVRGLYLDVKKSNERMQTDMRSKFDYPGCNLMDAPKKIKKFLNMKK